MQRSQFTAATLTTDSLCAPVTQWTCDESYLKWQQDWLQRRCEELETALIVKLVMYLPANIIVFPNSSRSMLRTWRAPASPCVHKHNTKYVSK